MKEIVIAQPLGITRELLESLASGLKKEGWNLTAYDKVPSGQEELGKRIEGADIAVIANYPLKKEALEKASSLKYLCVAFTGVDHVDISYCKERHIAVSNCAGYSTESVAELAFGMALSLYRMLPECGEAIRNGKTNAGLCGIELKGRKFGDDRLKTLLYTLKSSPCISVDVYRNLLQKRYVAPQYSKH